MYLPPAFREDNLSVLHDAIRANPLGTLITGGRSGLIANVLPFSLHCLPKGDVLRAHLAKANEQIRDLEEQTPALIMFQGPQAYVSPSWYPAKAEHGKVVPTWNYIIVQVSGTPTIFEDRDWLRSELDDLTNQHEDGRTQPWSVDDAPADFVAAQMKGIVGLEVPVKKITGKWKVSQNQPERNRLGVICGLQSEGRSDLADEIAARMRK